MPPPIKALAAGSGLVCLGGTGIWLTHGSREPKWKSVNKDSSNSYDASKYAHKYSRYLVSAEDEKNDPWWRWSYVTRYYKEAKDGFTLGTVSSWEALKEACKKAYGVGTSVTDGKVTASDTSTKYLEEDIWRFCSSPGERPKTINDLGENSQYKDKKAAGKESELISTTDGKNHRFWIVRDREFYGEDGFDAIEVEEADAYFKNGKAKHTPIKNLCRDAYEKPPSGDNSDPTQDQVVKYCSLNVNQTVTK